MSLFDYFKIPALMNKRNTIEYWTSREFKMHDRINSRARMLKLYPNQGEIINNAIYKRKDETNKLVRA